MRRTTPQKRQKRWTLLVLFFAIFVASPAQAIYTEIGASYVYKTSYIDSYNNSQTQGITASLSLYFWERVAIEGSYTNTLALNQAQAVSAASASVIYTRETDYIYGLDLIYMFADHKATFQPYIKGGVAYVTKIQNTQIDNNPQWTAGPYTGLAPEYGIGLKFLLTDAFAIRAGYDVQITPIGNSNTAQDINGRVGLSWMF